MPALLSTSGDTYSAVPTKEVALQNGSSRVQKQCIAVSGYDVGDALVVEHSWDTYSAVPTNDVALQVRQPQQTRWG